MNKSPLYNALVQYDNEKVYPFHMPGHKKRKGILESSGFDSIWMDVTEVPGMDNLYHAEGVIKEAQELAAKTFGSDETYFLVNGSTAGIITSILTVCSPGDEIIIARNCHRSAYSGMVLGDVRPVYIYPEMIKKYGIVGGISVKAVKEAILKHPKAKAVIITSPTYEGFTSNIKEIANLIHEYDKILIVDEAHGAHFVFDSNFPQTALNAGADLVIQSAHKTLPTLTQTALLHMKGKRVDKNRLKQMLSMIQTSSPSYVMMGMLDWCRGQLDERGTELFTRYMKQLQNMRTKLRKMNKVILVGEELRGTYGIDDIDISKLIFFTGYTNETGVEIDHKLRSQYQIQVELSSIYHLVGMTTIGDTQKGLKQLLSAIIHIDNTLMEKTGSVEIYNREIKSVKQICSPREAVFSKSVLLDIEKSCGFASAEFVIPYPPGIPLLCPGEVITKQQIIEIKKYKQMGIEIIGMKDPTSQTIQVIDEV